MSGPSSNNIRGSKYNPQTFTNLSGAAYTSGRQVEQPQGGMTRHRSAVQRKAQRNTLSKLLVVPDVQDNIAGIIDYAQVPNQEGGDVNDTRQLLERQAQHYNGGV